LGATGLLFSEAQGERSNGDQKDKN